MNRTIKILAPTAIFALSLIFAAGPVLADFTAVNESTGYNSENTVEAEANGGFEVVNVNTELIVNSGGGFVSTGGNETNENTGAADILSGDLAAFGDLLNEVNLNVTQETGAFGGDFLAKNDTTGADSDNEAESEMENYSSALNSNEADIMNAAFVYASTGDNEAEENTGAAEIDTGSGSVAITEGNDVNGNCLIIDNNAGDEDNALFSAMAVNDTTGEDSDNDTEAEIKIKIEAANANLADISNWVFAKINTGDNEIEENTGAGEINTGDAEAMADVLNQANMSETHINIDPIDTSDVSAMNSTTGHDSDNDAKAKIKAYVDVANANSALISNKVKLDSNTGDNKVKENTGAGTVNSGDATTDVEVENGSFLNKNVTDVNVDLGVSSVVASNDTTGAESDNDAKAELKTDVDVANANEALVCNDVKASANTCDNKVSENTGAGEINTGDASASASVLNEMNINQTDVTVAPISDVNASNSHTGAESDNDAEASASSNVSVSNVNTGTVVNNVNVSSNTGGNEANGNTAAAEVDTGSATMTFGVTNTANGNSTTIGN